MRTRGRISKASAAGGPSRSGRSPAKRPRRKADPPQPTIPNKAVVKKTVLIVDDHPLVRQAIAWLIGHTADLALCGEAGDFQAAIDAVEQLSPDVVIVDVRLKGRSGLELIKEICRRRPDLAVLVFSMHEEPLYAERALRLGARGYVTKAEPAETILQAIRRVVEGNVYISENLSSRVLRAIVAGRPFSGGLLVDQLSDRQFQVFELIGQGLGTREIAQRLCLSVKTIDTYREHIKQRLNLDSSSELLKYAIQWARSERGG